MSSTTTMCQKPRLGFIGGGCNSAIGPSHIAASRMDGRFDLIGGYFSRRAEINQQSHDSYGLSFARHDASYQAWLDRMAGQLDLVAVLTPSDDHAELVTEIVRRGLPLLIEKPIACSLDEVAQLQASLASNPGHYVRFVHNYSGYPLFREMVRLVKSGDIGAVRHVRVMMPSDSYAREKIIGRPQPWRQHDPQIPMLLLDLGTHMHHLVDMLIGSAPGRVMGSFKKLANSFDVIDHAEIWHERDDGIAVSYWMSKAHLGHKNGLEIEVYGDGGAMSWRQMDPDHLVFADLNSNRTLINRGAIDPASDAQARFKPGHPTGFIEAFANFYGNLADDFAAQERGGAGSPWICPPEQALAGIALLEAAADAHRNGNWMTA